MLSAIMFFEKNQTTFRLIYPDFGYCDGRKIKAYIFFTQKLVFQPIFLPKTLNES